MPKWGLEFQCGRALMFHGLGGVKLLLHGRKSPQGAELCLTNMGTSN